MALNDSLNEMWTLANHIQEWVSGLGQSEGFTSEQVEVLGALYEASQALLHTLYSAQSLQPTRQAVAAFSAACGVPLQSLRGYSDMLLMGIHGEIPPAYQPALQQIAAWTDTIAGIAQQLTDD